MQCFWLDTTACDLSVCTDMERSSFCCVIQLNQVAGPLDNLSFLRDYAVHRPHVLLCPWETLRDVLQAVGSASVRPSLPCVVQTGCSFRTPNLDGKLPLENAKEMADLLFSFSFLLGRERAGSDGNKSDLERLKPSVQSLVTWTPHLWWTLLFSLRQQWPLGEGQLLQITLQNCKSDRIFPNPSFSVKLLARLVQHHPCVLLDWKAPWGFLYSCTWHGVWLMSGVQYWCRLGRSEVVV